jgi:hypothetical protein
LTLRIHFSCKSLADPSLCISGTNIAFPFLMQVLCHPQEALGVYAS